MAGKLVHETAICSMFSGHKITIQGYTTQCKKECNCIFDINLECKTPCGKSSIPLCISVRFGEKCIARNTFNQCIWGQEEKNGGMPIIRGQPFVIELECKPQAFSISINSCYFCDYEHCLPINTINNLSVTGDVHIHYVNLSKSLQQECDPKPTLENTVHETTIGSMFAGCKVKVEGSTTQCSNGFDVNLESKTLSGTPSIPLRISVRFGEECIIRNTFDQCAWGQEERDGGMPIVREKIFFIELECKPESFSISINGCYFCDYKHHLPFNRINRLTVTGDVVIRDVGLSRTHLKSGNNQIMAGKLVHETAIGSMFSRQKITIQGYTTQCKKECNCSFDINLECKTPCGKSSIPLCISVQFGEKCIARNTFNQCIWGQEEKNGGMPIIRGQPFVIELECKPQAFSISINSCYFCDYQHRLPINTINNLSVTGDVHIHYVNLSNSLQQECDPKPTLENTVHETTIGSMFAGCKVKVEGSTTQCSNGFDVNLESKTPSGTPSIPLRISVRFGEECIIRNTFNQCGWGQEERDGGMPIVREKIFFIELECKPESFLISINGCFFCDYKHHLPFNTINRLTVTGDVVIRDIGLSGTPLKSGNNQIMASKLVHETAIGSMFSGHKITIQGYTTQRKKECNCSFDINLECKNPCGKSSIPLCISVRFGEKCIARNTFNQCSWGQEEKNGGIPIIRGQPFVIELECKPQAFSISINSCYFCDYQHRLPINTINNLSVTGDVYIHYDSFLPNIISTPQPVVAHPPVENQTPVELPAESQPLVETQPQIEAQLPVEIQWQDGAQMPVENQTLVENQPLVETQRQIEAQLPVEIQWQVEAQMPVENQTLVESQPLVETQTQVEAQLPVENQTLVESQPLVETHTQIEAQLPVEIQWQVEAQMPVENQTLVESQPLVETQTQVEVQLPVEIQRQVEAQIPVENQTLVESQLLVETQPLGTYNPQGESQVQETELLIDPRLQETLGIQLANETQIMKLIHKTAIPSMLPGQRIEVQGSTTQSCSRFVINLESKTSFGSSFTIPLHISVRFNEGCIVRNTFTQWWGEEERCGGMPITRGQPFIIEVVCKPEVFTININGCYFCDYKNRLHNKTVDILTVNGNDDVKIYDVSFNGTPHQNQYNDTMPFDFEHQPLC